MIILKLLLLLTNLHLKLLSTQGTGADKLLALKELILFFTSPSRQALLLLHVNDQLCSILTKGSTCRKNKKLRFFLILIEQVMTNLLKKN